jgi:hypothetical protein
MTWPDEELRFDEDTYLLTLRDSDTATCEVCGHLIIFHQGRDTTRPCDICDQRDIEGLTSCPCSEC